MTTFAASAGMVAPTVAIVATVGAGLSVAGYCAKDPLLSTLGGVLLGFAGGYSLAATVGWGASAQAFNGIMGATVSAFTSPLSPAQGNAKQIVGWAWTAYGLAVAVKTWYDAQQQYNKLGDFDYERSKLYADNSEWSCTASDAPVYSKDAPPYENLIKSIYKASYCGFKKGGEAVLKAADALATNQKLHNAVEFGFKAAGDIVIETASNVVKDVFTSYIGTKIIIPSVYGDFGITSFQTGMSGVSLYYSAHERAQKIYLDIMTRKFEVYGRYGIH